MIGRVKENTFPHPASSTRASGRSVSQSATSLFIVIKERARLNTEEISNRRKTLLLLPGPHRSESVNRTGRHGSIEMRLVDKLPTKFCHRFSVLSIANGRCHSSREPYKYQLVPLHHTPPSSPTMSTISARAPGAITIGGATVYPDTNSCFACTPPFDHQRDWQPKPDTPGRARTLVVCFDGTGDSFDQDVSTFCYQLGSVLIVYITELQCRPILIDVEERRSCQAARLLSGSLPRTSIKSTISSSSFSGWHRNLYGQRCHRHADHPSHLQIVGPNGRLESPFAHQRLLLPSSHPMLHSLTLP